MRKTSRSNRGFTAIEPLRREFPSGLPILVYHKVGPLPAGIKMRSLYVEERLFAWQIRNLKSNGFSHAILSSWSPDLTTTPNRVVLTFDDGSRTVLHHAMAALAGGEFKAIQFIVAGAIGQRNEWDVRDLGEVPDALMDEAEIREWLSAGHEIGAHTITHPRLTRIPIRQAAEEISGSKKKLEDLFGIPIRHFCYPYGCWNPAIRDLVEEAGFETAVTLDFGVNDTAHDRFALRRIGVRHPARKLRNLLAMAAAGFPMRFFFQR